MTSVFVCQWRGVVTKRCRHIPAKISHKHKRRELQCHDLWTLKTFVIKTNSCVSFSIDIVDVRAKGGRWSIIVPRSQHVWTSDMQLRHKRWSFANLPLLPAGNIEHFLWEIVSCHLSAGHSCNLSKVSWSIEQSTSLQTTEYILTSSAYSLYTVPLLETFTMLLM